MKITCNKKIKNNSVIILPVYKNKKGPKVSTGINLSSETLDNISAMKTSGGLNNTQFYFDQSAGHVLAIGMGNKKECNKEKYSHAISKAINEANSNQYKQINILLEGKKHWVKETIITAINQEYQIPTKSEKKNHAKTLNFLTADEAELGSINEQIQIGQAIGESMKLTRTLSDLPGNTCTPSFLAEEAIKLSDEYNSVKTTIFEEHQMEKMGMGALLAVSKGSEEDAKLIVMEYFGNKTNEKPIVLVGKGLTFDAGGISIKPSGKMDEMKYDMCGGASVFGVIKACAELKLPINVTGIIPSSENLPDGKAFKPGDILTSMSGKTIEVLNTDAEGRLILCDALTFAKRFKPKKVIDIATLTGACIVALGNDISGLMANDDKLAELLFEAGENSGDKTWRLPLGDSYQKQIDSKFADIANIGTPGAGTITAACFLSRFTEEFKWAHLDIAGVAWSSSGATGRPVPLLMEYLLSESIGESI